MMLPTPYDASAMTDADRGGVLRPAARLSITVDRRRGDEIRRLRAKLLKLILENQARRERERQLGMAGRGAG